MNTSLRRRLLIWLTGTIAAAGVVTAALSFWIAYDEANELQDAQLTQVAAVIARHPLVESHAGVATSTHEEVEARFVIKALGSAPANADPERDLSLLPSMPDGLHSVEQRGVRWRVHVGRNTAGEAFAVAQRMTLRDEVAIHTALLALLPVVLLVPALLVAVNVVLLQGFAPLNRMSSEVDTRDATSTAALDERDVPSEALPLVQAMNRLMHRLALVLEQQRRLVSDAAHELRTPVATLIVQADNVLNVTLPQQATDRMTALREGLTRMSSLIDQLLRLARIQGASPAPTRLDLRDIVKATIEDALPLAEARGVDLGCLRQESAVVLGDEWHARAIVRNLVDNAVRYTPRGGAVDVSVFVQRPDAWIVIEDSGSGIDPADRQRVFEPFVRVLGSDETGSGLGLAIARGAAHALGGSITLSERSDGDRGLRAAYHQPAAAPA